MLIVVGVEVFRVVTVLLVFMMILTMIVMMGMVVTVLVLMLPVLVAPRVTDPPGRVLGEADPVIIVRNPGKYSRQSRLKMESGEEHCDVSNALQCADHHSTLQLSAPLDTSPMSWGPVL